MSPEVCHMTAPHDGHPWDTAERSVLARSCPGQSPLLEAAADPDNTARLLLVTRYVAYVGRDETQVFIHTRDLLWNIRCTHGHRSEDAAAKCARQVAAEWRRRKAATVVVVNGGTTVEWQWRTARGMEYSRCTPVQAPDDAVLVDLGPVG